MRFARVALALVASLAFAGLASPEAHAAPKKKARTERAPRTHERTERGAENAQGIYVRGDTAARKDFDKFLANARAHGVDMVVLDAKDYDGLLTYESHVPLARASGAVAAPPIEDFGAAIAKI